jgi:hypothetical protein
MRILMSVPQTIVIDLSGALAGVVVIGSRRSGMVANMAKNRPQGKHRRDRLMVHHTRMPAILRAQ